MAKDFEMIAKLAKFLPNLVTLPGGKIKIPVSRI